MAAQSNGSVVVVGGGIVGLVAARAIARAGSDAIVLEKGTVGSEASWAAAGMLIPLAESDPGAFRALALSSFALHERWVLEIEADVGRAVGFERTGQLSFAHTSAGVDKLWRMYVELPRDAEAEWLEGAALQRAEPALTPQTSAAIHFPHAAHVDNRRLVPALHRSAIQAGVRVREHTEVVGIERAGGPGVRVHTATGEVLYAERVVMAAGAWCSRIRGVDPALDMRPIRGQMLALRCSGAPPMTKILDGEDVYLVPRGSRVLVGGTKEDRGFDRTLDPDTVLSQRSAAVAAIPALADATLDETWVGFRPRSGHGEPVFDWDREIPGLFYATGHYRNGILLAPITERIIEQEFLAGESLPVADPFRLPH